MINLKNPLKLKRMGIDTHQEAVVYMRADCHVCRAEGFQSQARVLVKTKTTSTVATLNVVYDHLLSTEEAGLSESAWKRLKAVEGELAEFSHPQPIDSLSDVRAKVYGKKLSKESLQGIVWDISSGRYADVHLASFITACAGESMDVDEITYMTEAMVDAGEKLDWHRPMVVDKHCAGGLPGNRTTPIIVAIVAACGLTMPKTSSRAITSPSGTADTMEVMAPVDLTISQMRQVVEKEGGCITWGGSVDLSPADDILIRVERALDLDSEGQLIASVLSKKKAAGSTHVVIDVPTGPTAKVRSDEMAQKLSTMIKRVGERIGLKVCTVVTDGLQPVGRGIGPALEAVDVLKVLRNASDAPQDLQARSFVLAGHILELSGKVPIGQGYQLAQEVLSDGRALKKFMSICEAQGGFREPHRASFTQTIPSVSEGIVKAIDNRKLARVAKLAGAPIDKAAGVYLEARIGDQIRKGQTLFTVHAESRGELEYALEYVARHQDIVTISI